MKANRRVIAWLTWYLLTGALPAYANMPPQPDGVFGLILIFPVVAVALRWARVEFTGKEKRWKVLRGLALALCMYIAIAGSIIGYSAMAFVVAYGLVRAGHVIRRGQGRKRYPLGILVILLSLAAALNYLAAISVASQGANWTHFTARGMLERLAEAEASFQASGAVDANGNGIGEYGTFQQLHQARFLREILTSGELVNGYRFVVVLSGDPERDEKEYLIYATPEHYYVRSGWEALPGYSLLAPRRLSGRLTFAVDERGRIKERDLGESRAITREEAARW